ncbi:MAG TPA: Minf_1886 family protein [Lacipirellulaceae bacterium]|nr:Minf_1886 family protein [Lacipirellulaceae bacterium]
MLDQEHPLTELLRRDRRYHRDAYFFIFEALKHAQENMGMGQSSTSEEEEEAERHVTGQQLCEAIRQYAVQQFGLMAKSVLNEWGVRNTGDFGEIVFNLIDVKLMRKTESDRREDFDNVFDFDDGLRDAFLPITSDS